jgi:hypothetical protein
MRGRRSEERSKVFQAEEHIKPQKIVKTLMNRSKRVKGNC